MLPHVPFGSLITHPKSEEEYYLERFSSLPKQLREMITAAKTGSFITGLTKSYDLALETTTPISFAVVQVAFGEKTLAQLPSMLSTQLQIANDKAQAMAAEIEKELFTPVMLELNAYLAQKKKTAGSPPNVARGVQNVIDLKNQPRPPPAAADTTDPK